MKPSTLAGLTFLVALLGAATPAAHGQVAGTTSIGMAHAGEFLLPGATKAAIRTLPAFEYED